MKQKIVVEVPMHCEKCRTKALKIAAAAQGVSKVSIEGANQDLVEVIGDGVDSVCLAMRLRKKLRSACIVKVEEVKPENKADAAIQWGAPASYVHGYCPPQCPPIYYKPFCDSPEQTTCSIM